MSETVLKPEVHKYIDTLLFGRRKGFYIDIGACDPIIDSVTCPFYRRGWRGINIEPNVHMFRRLSLERPEDINLNVAISNKISTQTFCIPDVPQLGTLNPEVLQRDSIEEYPIQVLPLLTAIDPYIHHEKYIDFLSIDVEGNEHKVLQGIDWKKYRFRPELIIIESTYPCTDIPTYEEWEYILLSKGYMFAVEDGLNRYYQYMGPDWGSQT